MSRLKNTLLVGLAAALAGQLSSCATTDREAGSSTKDPRTTYVPPGRNDRSRVDSRTVLNTVNTTHTFSDPQQPDNFELQLRGTRVLTAMAHLIVTNSKGDTLRHEVLPARALLDEKLLDDPQAASMRDKEIAILQGMNNYFAADRFTQPAIPAGTPPPAEMDARVWTAVREDPGARAFDYIGQGGAERRMAYSPKLRRIVVISQ